MFELVKNQFLKDGCVWYKDDKGNTLFIRADQLGNSFCAKIRVIDSHYQIDKKDFSYPYSELTGVNFNFLYNSGDTTEPQYSMEDIYAVFNNAISIIYRWIIICDTLKQIQKENTHFAAKLFAPKEKQKETISNYEDGIIYNGLCNLMKFEEMYPYLSLWGLVTPDHKEESLCH